MSKVHVHYQRIDPRNGVKTGDDPFGMHFDFAHYDRINLCNGVSHSVSGFDDDSFHNALLLRSIRGKCM